LVSDGRPLVILSVNPGELAAMPTAAQLIQPSPVANTELAFLNLVTNWGAVPVWILRAGEFDAMARSLRLNLLRLHAEHEVLVPMVGGPGLTCTDA
jgi:hypothetical protein